LTADTAAPKRAASWSTFMVVGRWRCGERIKECGWGKEGRGTEQAAWLSVGVLNECRKLVESESA
jgi:hypothetical protein